MKERVSFARLAFENKKKKTRREKFLEEMDQVIPWKELLKIIRKHYPKAGNGRQPMPLERMLRIYFLQQWYGLSDPAMEDALYDLEIDAVPDETTILNFSAFAGRTQPDREGFREDKTISI